MTRSEERELFRLVKENNMLLKWILQLIRHDEENDFSTNVIANIIGNRLDNRIGYGQKRY
jgi:hypothetical protein